MEFRILFALNWKIHVSFSTRLRSHLSLPLSLSIVYYWHSQPHVRCIQLNFLRVKRAVNNSTVFNSHFNRAVSQREIEWAMIWSCFSQDFYWTIFEWIIDIGESVRGSNNRYYRYDKWISAQSILSVSHYILFTWQSLCSLEINWLPIISLCCELFFRFISKMFRMAVFFLSFLFCAFLPKVH